MYNEEIKRRFLEIWEPGASEMKRQVSLFNNTEKTEEELGKDVCEFNSTEFEYLFRNSPWKSYATMRTVKTSLTKYVEWAAEEGICKKNYDVYNINVFSVSNKVSVRDSHVSDIYDLFDVLEALYPTTKFVVNESDLSLVDVSAMILLFYGISRQDLPYVTRDDIDATAGVIRFGSYVTNPLDQKSLDILKCLADSEIVTVYDAHESFRKVGFETSNRLLRRADVKNSCKKFDAVRFIDAIETRYRTMRRVPTNPKHENSKRKVHFAKIYKSGVYYRAYQYKLETGKDPSNTDMIRFVGSPQSDISHCVNLQTDDFGIALRNGYLAWMKEFHNPDTTQDASLVDRTAVIEALKNANIDVEEVKKIIDSISEPTEKK